MWQACGKLRNSIYNELTFRANGIDENYTFMYAVVFSVHVRMLLIKQLTISIFLFLSIDKMKENNQHNKILNE